MAANGDAPTAKHVDKHVDNSSADHDDDLCGDDGDDDCQYIFPQRLMSILGNEKNHDAICWLPNGRAFIIRNRNLFAAKIMPRFFPRKSKFSSFTRKLNRWYDLSLSPIACFFICGQVGFNFYTLTPFHYYQLVWVVVLILAGTLFVYLAVPNLERTIMSSSCAINPTLQLKCSARMLAPRLLWRAISRVRPSTRWLLCHRLRCQHHSPLLSLVRNLPRCSKKVILP
jgi:hypothetical protein